jgi:hypothetical protein
VTLLLARLKEAEGLRAELCGEAARVIKIQDADEIAAEAAVDLSAEPPVASIGALPASDRFVFYQEQPYERDAQLRHHENVRARLLAGSEHDVHQLHPAVLALPSLCAVGRAV